MVTMIMLMPMVKSGNSDDELRVVEKIMKCWHVGHYDGGGCVRFQ